MFPLNPTPTCFLELIFSSSLPELSAADPAYLHVAEIDVPGLLVRIIGSAAGECGRCLKLCSGMKSFRFWGINRSLGRSSSESA
jgi:hypothetical protein